MESKPKFLCENSRTDVNDSCGIISRMRNGLHKFVV